MTIAAASLAQTEWDRAHPWAEGMPAAQPAHYRQSMGPENAERVWRCNDCSAIYPAHHPDRCRIGRTYDAEVEREGAYLLRSDDIDSVPYCTHCGAECFWEDDTFQHRARDVARQCWGKRFGL